MLWIRDSDPLPPTSRALGHDSDAPGLLAIGGALTPQRLREAYSHGIFPWFSPGQPVLWWSPDPRMVLMTDEFRLHRSLKKALKRFLATPGCELRFDFGLRQVVAACAQTVRDGQRGTWIVPDMVEAYAQWHREGAVHSVETWIDGELAGGLYGVNLGRMFFGESMFSRATDASKLALAALVAFCRSNGIAMIDCQQNTSHLASMGAREITRAAFERHIAHTVHLAPPPRWTYDPAHWSELDPALLAHPQA
jgi:leucyl/phenylalanyl-tRNA---protein transferase